MDAVLNAAEQVTSPTDISPTVSDFDAFLIRHLPQGPFNWSFVVGAVFAFLSQLSSIGKGLQKVGVQSLPELSCRQEILWQYLGSTTWRNGVILDVAGALCGLVSLTILPISVAQPIFCNGLVLLACYSHFYLKEQLARREWRAIGLCFSGTVMLAVTLVPRDWSRTHVGWLQVKLFVVLLMVLPLICAAEMGIRRAKRARGVPNRGPNRQAIELLVGLQAGLCIGVGNASLASGLQSTSRSWIDHVARELNGSETPEERDSTPWPVDEPWPPGVWLHLVCAAAFAVVGIAMNAMHPVFANRGYQHGRVVLISTHTALVSMATGVCVGIGVLDEAWPARPLFGALRLLAFVLMLTGAYTMNRQNIRSLATGRHDKVDELTPETPDSVLCAAPAATPLRHDAGSPTRAPQRVASDGVPVRVSTRLAETRRPDMSTGTDAGIP